MATIQNDTSLFESEYDTDTISLTSTVGSDWSENALYDVEEIISEDAVLDENDNPISKYLTKWVGYPLHKCTWEPVEHLHGTTLLQDWDNKFVELGDAAFTKLVHDNHAAYDAALQTVAAAKARRQRLRAKKRQKLKSPKIKVENAKTRPFIVDSDGDGDSDSDSDSDIPLIHGARARQNALSAKEIRPPRRPLLQPSLSSVSSSNTEDSLDSSMEQLKTKDSEAERRKFHQKPAESIGRPQRAKNQSGSRKKTEKHIGSSSRAVPQSSNVHKGKDQDEAVRPSINDSCHPAPREITEDTNANASESSTAPEMGRPMQSMKRTAPSIRMVNEPKTGPLKAAWHKGGDQAAYSKMHFRRKAELRGRNEATPDPAALLFINAPPNLMPRSSDLANDSLYGRRDSVAVRPTRPNGSHDETAAPSTTQVPDWEKEKVPMTCFEWRNGSCRYSAEVCWFLHRHTATIGPANGVVPPKYGRPKITCPYWMKGRCSKSGDSCDFAHYNTGWLPNGTKGQPPVQIDGNSGPDPPVIPRSLRQPLPFPQDNHVLKGKELTCYFWMHHPGGCNKLETQCRYSHRNTGWLRQKGGEPGPHYVRIDPLEQPLSMKMPGRKTCFFWHRGRSCTKGDNCMYAHYDTGRIADPPPGYNQEYQMTSDAPISFFDMDDSFSQSTSTFDPLSRPNAIAIAISTTPFEQATGLNKCGSLSKKEKPTVCNLDPGFSSLSCLEFQKTIENSCKLNFADMFVEEKEGTMLARTAFLIFHPGNHAKELELITRWLHLHHVEVRTVWLDGSWEDFKQIIVGGSTGVIIVHPDFQNYSELLHFGQVLRRNVRIWAVGLRNSIEYDPNISTIDPVLRYDRIEVFPRGGIIYITDDVFEEMPARALKIIELFIAKVKRCRQVTGPGDPSKLVDDGFVPWRLATRPGLMENIWEQCLAHEKAIDAQDPVQSTRAKLYDLLHRTGYVDQDHSPIRARPEDYFPIMSERPEFIPEYEQALRRSQDAANSWMVQMYAGLAIDHRRHYRQYYVVHTHSTKPDWKETCQNISEVIDPERCIEYFQQSEGPAAIFDFYEWAFAEKASVVDS